jgi:hypothetical protein
MHHREAYRAMSSSTVAVRSVVTTSVAAFVAVVGAGLVVADQHDPHRSAVESPVPQTQDLGDLHGVDASVAADLGGAPFRGGGEVGWGAQSGPLGAGPS